jgi:hypothetical protein
VPEQTPTKKTRKRLKRLRGREWRGSGVELTVMRCEGVWKRLITESQVTRIKDEADVKGLW